MKYCYYFSHTFFGKQLFAEVRPHSCHTCAQRHNETGRFRQFLLKEKTDNVESQRERALSAAIVLQRCANAGNVVTQLTTVPRQAAQQ